MDFQQKNWKGSSEMKPRFKDMTCYPHDTDSHSTSQFTYETVYLGTRILSWKQTEPNIFKYESGYKSLQDFS